MEVPPSGPGTAAAASGASEEQLRVKRKTLQAVLEQCHKALEMLQEEDLDLEPAASDWESRASGEMDQDSSEGSSPSSACAAADFEADELSEFLKSKVESRDFLEKLGSNETSVLIRISADEIASWNMVNSADFNAENGSDEDDYVLVKQEDIVDGIASFMAAYLLSLEETKDLTPERLQQALSKTFAVKKKSKLHKAWDGSKVVYNVASLGATALGIFQNPALIQVASTAFWTSCRVISKFL